MEKVFTVLKNETGRILSIKKETTPINIDRYLSNSDTQAEIQRAIYGKLSEMNVNNLLVLQAILLKLDASHMQLYELLSVLNNKIDRNHYELQNKINALENKLNQQNAIPLYTPDCSRCKANALYCAIQCNRCL